MTTGRTDALLVSDPQGSRRLVEVGDRPVLLGRHRDADVRLDHITVSLRHAEVFVADGMMQVVDLGSLNGVFVNGVRVLQAHLEPGDDVRIGTFRMWVAGAALAAAG